MKMKSDGEVSTPLQKENKKTFEEWAEWYEKKTGENLKIMPEDHVVYHEDKGFLVVMPVPSENALLIRYMCGDGKYWEKVATEMADEIVATRFFFATRRNPKTFERRFGAKIRTYLMEREVHV